MPMTPGVNFEFPTVTSPPASIPGVMEIGGQPPFYQNVVPGGSVSIAASGAASSSSLGIVSQGLFVVLLPAGVAIQYNTNNPNYGGSSNWVTIIPAQSAATWLTLILDGENFQFANTSNAAAAVTTILAIQR